MTQVTLKLSQSIGKQIEQGKNAATMSGEVMSPTEPRVVALNTANTDLSDAYAELLETRQAAKAALVRVKALAKTQRTAYGNLGLFVQAQAEGSAPHITSCGFRVRASRGSNPAVVDAPGNLRTKVNGIPGNVYFSWTPPTGAQFFEVQSTTDLAGETGWTGTDEMPSKAKATFEGLTSGTRYSFRVRAWGNGKPGPWSSPIQQMVL